MPFNFFRFFFSITTLFILFYTVTVGINGFFRYNKFQQEFLLKSSQLDELKFRQKRIDYMLKNLNKNSYWEMLSRKKLHMVKPGEVAYRFYYKGDQ